MDISTEYRERGSRVFFNLVQDSFLSQHVLEATRGENVLDIVLSSQKEFVDNVKICEPLGCSDHNQIHFIIKVKGEQNRKIRYRKKFHKGRYKDMREYLAKIDWNNTLKNKTATECWNILKSEIVCVVDKFVPLKQQGKRSKKKHLSKEAIRKIKYKQMMWKTYRHTGSEEDCSIYKEAPNRATAEIRNSKRSYEQKIAFNIKHDSKSFYAYVRSKQKVQDKVSPLEGSDGNIITEGFLMAENLNEYFSSVFTREDISILPVLETKFEGREFDYLGQLIVTPTMVAMKIRDMKDNKSPGVDGIPPKLLLEIVEQISIPLATVFNLSLQEGIVPISADMKVSEQCGIAAAKGNQILGLIRRNIVYKEKELIKPLYKTIVRPHLEYCIQAWRPYRKKDIDMLERVHRRATKMIPKLRNISYEMRLKECGLTTLETRRLRGDQIEVFKILNGYENIDRNIFSQSKKREGLEDMELH